MAYCNQDDCCALLPCAEHVNIDWYIDQKTSDYHPGTRLWVFDDIREWSHHGPTKVCWLSGNGGMGKSVVSSQLVAGVEGIGVTAYHFCHHDEPVKSSFYAIVRSLAIQLEKHFPSVLLPTQDVWCDEADYWEKWILQPFSRIDAVRPFPLVVLDALDELPPGVLVPLLQLISGNKESVSGERYDTNMMAKKMRFFVTVFF